MRGLALGVLLALPPLLIGPASAAESQFDSRAAWRHVERLVGFGPRPSGSSALARARTYLVAELETAGLTVRQQAFIARTPDGPITMVNVIGEVAGRRPEVILVGGHYDTKHFRAFRFVGAHDGASGTGLLLELARSLAQAAGEFTYRFVFFDGEEARRKWTRRDGAYGSRHMVEALRREGSLGQIRAVVVVDMIGDRDLTIRKEQGSTAWLTEVIWGSARRLGHRARFLNETLPVEDDHTPFLRAGVPATLLIDFDYPYWHTSDDTLDKLSPRSLGIVGEVLLDGLRALEVWLTREGGTPRN